MGNGYIIETNCYSLGHEGLFCGTCLTSLISPEGTIIQGKTVMYRYSKSLPGHSFGALLHSSSWETSTGYVLNQKRGENVA